MKKPADLISRLVLALIVHLFAQHANAAVIQIDPALLSGTASVDFEDLGLANGAQVTFDTSFESGFTLFSERFAGQTLSTSGDFDVLSGSPAGPLALVSGLPAQNVTAIDGGAGDFGNTAIAGSGQDGFPSNSAVGEGSIAMLFDFDQSEFGFDIVGGNGGTATLQFWARDGSLLDEVVLNLTSSIFDSYGFKFDDGSKVIAGVSIFNDDPGGIGFDNFISDVAGVPGNPSQVPEPSSMALLGTGLMMALRRARSKR